MAAISSFDLNMDYLRGGFVVSLNTLLCEIRKKNCSVILSPSAPFQTFTPATVSRNEDYSAGSPDGGGPGIMEKGVVA